MAGGPPYDREMPLWEHLAELGRRLKRVAVAAAIVFLLTWLPAPDSSGSPLSAIQAFFVTGEYRPLAYWAFNATMSAVVGQGNSTGIELKLIGSEVWNPLAAVMYLSLYITALVVMPYFIYEMWLYVKPALYPHEMRAVRRYMGLGLLLFYLGNAFGILVIFPALLRFVVGLSRVIHVEPVFSVYSVVGMWIQLAFWTGLFFQVPIVLAVLAEMCLMNPWAVAEYRPVVYAASLILIAVVTPDTTLVSTFLTFIPFALLFELGLAWSRRIARKCPDVKPPSPRRNAARR